MSYPQTAHPGPRPGTVTFVVVLTWISAVLTLISGGVWLWASGDTGFLADVDTSAQPARIYGWTLLGLGVVTLLVAVGLGNGSRFSRFIVNAIMAIRLVLDLIVIFSVPGFPEWQAIASIIWSALILIFLNNRRASLWFLRT
ncbi:hypothetical protein [Demequina sediminicola]|uniref:hypothetical protein n=1 Tax=Demequina sediminicola TaxID=1095026 RepID=UPI000783C198|nr:hypothetical protein [Demequina sediminicola]